MNSAFNLVRANLRGALMCVVLCLAVGPALAQEIYSRCADGHWRHASGAHDPALAQQGYPRRAEGAKRPSLDEIVRCQYDEASCLPCPPKPHAMEPKTLIGIHDQQCGPNGGEPHWNQGRPIPWDIFGQGEYLGPHRTQHLLDYRIRVDDQFDFVYFTGSEISNRPYRFMQKDKLKIESSPTDEIVREVEVQPDGTIVLPLKPPIQAANLTVMQLKARLEELYNDVYVNPVFTVTPVQSNSKVKDLTDVVDVRAGNQGRTRTAKVAPDGTVQLPYIAHTFLVGLNLVEAENEINARYTAEFGAGVHVTVQLSQRAPRFAYVIGEVKNPGRFQLDQPTDIIQLLALAGGPINGGNSRQIIVFRRTEDWRLIATRLDLRGTVVVGARPMPADNIWIRDLDVVVIPKTPVQLTDDALELVFTRGVYRALPVFWSYGIPW
jgi:polysaccharide biosynthesis/export protein